MIGRIAMHPNDDLFSGKRLLEMEHDSVPIHTIHELYKSFLHAEKYFWWYSLLHLGPTNVV
jgi:hypothetical protein